MKMDDMVLQALDRYMPRVTVRVGNGLSKNMNQCIRSYDQLPQIIVRTVSLLAGMEALFDFGGAVRLHTMDIYKTLMDMHDDWVEETPRLGARSEHQVFADRLMEAIDTGHMPPESQGRGTVEFVRRPLLPFHQFSAAWTIARRIGVIEGRGEIGLSRSLLANLKKITESADQMAS